MTLLLAPALVQAEGGAGASSAGNVERGKKLWEGKAGCGYCHGWAGDGHGDPRSEGGAPSLRVSELDRDQLIEVIACGRPATGMPHHDRFAYTDDRCYGLTGDALGADKPRRATNTLQKHEIEAVADYLLDAVIGKGPVTAEQCVAFFGHETEHCTHYPKAGS